MVIMHQCLRRICVKLFLYLLVVINTIQCDQPFLSMHRYNSPIRSRLIDIHLNSALKVASYNKFSPLYICNIECNR